MDQACRICRSATASLVNIYEEHEHSDNEPSLVDMLNECVSCQIQAKDQDLLPQTICLCCLQDAQNAFRFKRRCEESYEYFCQMLNTQIKQEPVVVNEATFSEKDQEEIENSELEFKIETNSEEIATHVESSQELSIEHFSCKICTRAFPLERELRRHYSKLHAGQKSHICTTCNKSFARPSQLAKHMRTHTGERPFKCTECPRTFADGCALKMHIRSHNGDLPYQCSCCRQTFRMKGHYTEHMRIHTGERPFKCTHCPKTYTRNSHLQRHLREHRGKSKT